LLFIQAVIVWRIFRLPVSADERESGT
jgi:hypothetical protein